MIRVLLGVTLVALAAGCSGPVVLDPGDSGNGLDVDAGIRNDAGDIDAGDIDAGDIDAGGTDAGDTDAGTPRDAGNTGDAGATGDAGTTRDAGSPTDAGATNAGRDAGSTPDAGTTTDAGTVLTLGCSDSFTTEAFRDDFNGSALDSTRWDVVQQNTSGTGGFTALTKMLASNVSVSGGRLHMASHRHCTDPYPNGAPVNPASCAGTNYYSGSWIKSKSGFASGKGQLRFLAKIPAAVAGTFPALWARNTQGATDYGELDLIEQWWDGLTKGVASNPKTFSSTTWMANGGQFKSNGNLVGPVLDVNGGLHVYEVEWDATAGTVVYSWRDTPASAKVVLKTVDATTPGLSGNVSATAFKAILNYPFRAYVDFAVQVDTAYHVSPDLAASYAPADIEVDSVVICSP